MIHNSREHILELKSKAALQAYVEWVGTDVEKFRGLMELFFDEHFRVNQRASWPVGKIGEQHPELIQPYLAKMIEHLDQPAHDAVKRNTIRILADLELPEDLLGPAYERCFGYLNDPEEPIAIRVFSMTVCFNITKVYPELGDELYQAIEFYLPHGSAGFKSRGRKIMKALTPKP